MLTLCFLPCVFFVLQAPHSVVFADLSMLVSKEEGSQLLTSKVWPLSEWNFKKTVNLLNQPHFWHIPVWKIQDQCWNIQETMRQYKEEGDLYIPFPRLMECSCVWHTIQRAGAPPNAAPRGSCPLHTHMSSEFDNLTSWCSECYSFLSISQSGSFGSFFSSSQTDIIKPTSYYVTTPIYIIHLQAMSISPCIFHIPTSLIS